MEKVLILNKSDFEKFSEIRHALVAIGAVIILQKKGMLTTEEAFNRIIDQIKMADDAMIVFSVGGL